MEVLIIGIVVIVGVSYWIWAEGNKSKKTVVKSEPAVAPILTETVAPAPKKAKKPAAPKKVAAIKPAPKTATKKPKAKTTKAK